MGITKVGVTWYWRFQVDGKVRTGSCHTTSKPLAQKYEAKKRKEIDDERVNGKRVTTTIAEALQTFLDSREKQGEYNNIATLVNKTLGSKLDKLKNRIRIHGIDPSTELQNVSMADVQRLIMARKTEGNGSQTILTELTYLKQAIRLAAKLGYAVPSLDFASLKRDNQLRPSKGRERFITVDEEQRLLPHLSGDTHDLVCILLDTGARHSEIAELTWKAVDLDDRAISLYRPKVRNQSVLPMTDRVAAILKRRYDDRGESEHVFTAKDGGARNYCPLALQTACKKAGIEGVTFHILRHTAASRLAQAGASLQDIAQLLGHTTIAMSQRYSHLVPSQSLARSIHVLNGVGKANFSATE